MAKSSIKLVVAGAYGAGKTTFIGSIADSRTIRTETVPSGPDGPAGDKKTTTVAMDFAKFVVDGAGGGVDLLLFGLPGQARFEFMWKILMQGAVGYVMLVDASDEASWDKAAHIERTLSEVGDIPRVLAVNRDGPGVDLEELRRRVAMPAGVPIVRCDPRSRPDVVSTLLNLFIEVTRPRPARPQHPAVPATVTS